MRAPTRRTRATAAIAAAAFALGSVAIVLAGRAAAASAGAVVAAGEILPATALGASTLDPVAGRAVAVTLRLATDRAEGAWEASEVFALPVARTTASGWPVDPAEPGIPVRVHRVAPGVYHGTLTLPVAGDYVLFDRSAALADARHVTATKYPAPLNLRVGSSPGSAPDAKNDGAAGPRTASGGTATAPAGSATGGSTSVAGGAATPANRGSSATRRHLLEWAVATVVLLAIIGFGTNIRAARQRRRRRRRHRRRRHRRRLPRI